MGYISGPQLFIFTSARLAKDGLGYLSWFQNNHSFDSHPSCIKIVFKSLYAHACGVIYFFLYVIHLWYIVVLPVGFQWIVWILLNFVCMLKTRVGLIFLSSVQVKKHIKQGQGHEGGIFSVEAPLHASNVQVLDPATQ